MKTRRTGFSAQNPQQNQVLSLNPTQNQVLYPKSSREIVILLPNNQHQHRTLHIQKDLLPYALC